MSTKILLFSRPLIAHTAHDVERIFSLIEQYGFDFAINNEFAEIVEQLTSRTIEPQRIYAYQTGEQPEKSVMLCLGGDGTLLEGVHRLSNKSTPVAAINLGHLGFLTSATRDDIETLLHNISNDTLEVQPRTLLSVEGVEEQSKVLALNEVAIQRLEASMLKVEAKVDGQTVAQYNGDGLIVSTPTGSTAYSLSAGGPIIYPQADVFLLTAVAPHSLNVRPIVIADDKTLHLTIESRNGSFLVAVDGISSSYPEHTTLTLCKAPYTTRVVKQEGSTFFHTLQKKMMWGTDPRE